MNQEKHLTDDSTKNEHGTVNRAEGGKAEVHDATGKYVSIVAIVLAALALGHSMLAPELSRTRAELAEARVDAVKQDSATKLDALKQAHDLEMKEVRKEARDAETQLLLVREYLIDPSYRTKAEIASFEKFTRDRGIQ